jgi:electron transport complex protein RnfB
VASLEQVNNLLPQTQCEQCGYKGCKPYAQALISGEAKTNLCVPGGMPTMLAISKILDVSPELQLANSEKKPIARTIKIREDECIGCTKCIQVCPTGAIVGGAKQMHTVVDAYCTGCELCLPICPTHCMDVIDSAPEQPSWVIDNPIQHHIATYHKTRFDERNERTMQSEDLKREKDLEKQQKQIKFEISACLARVKAKKNDSIQNQQNFSKI